MAWAIALNVPEASAPAAARHLPVSIAARLAGALAIWSLAVVAALGISLWMSASREVDELLDEALVSASDLLVLLADADLETLDRAREGLTAAGGNRFAWQVRGPSGIVLQRSQDAPPDGWPRPERAGFHDLAGWRLYTRPLPKARMLTVGQARSERVEARREVIATAGGTALLVALLGHLWLRARVRRELHPLEALSDRIRQLQLDSATHVSYLGPASRSELVSIHEALETLSARLANRMAKERAFSAHAAHALRTPLAGMDVQLAIAIRESPDALRDRLVRIRQAARQLQYVVTALLGLFRSQAPARHVDLEVDALVRSLPTPSLTVSVRPDLHLKADPDLMAAALVNLLDNAQRHGARTVRISAWPAGGLLLQDDGPGVTPARRQALLQALRSEIDAGSIGLGLMLADSVARAHGGTLTLPDVTEGFAVALEFGHESSSPS